MKRVFSAIFFLAVVALLAAWNPRGGTQENVLPVEEKQSQPAEIHATLQVGEKTYALSMPQGSSLYEAMETARAESGLQFRGRNFPGLGFFVQEINGLEQNPRLGKYWIYYINDEKAEVGISVYTVNDHDIISWKYEDEE